MRDKALTCVKNTEDSSLRTVLSAIQVKCEPDNTYIQISSHDRQEFTNYQIDTKGNDLELLIDWQERQTKAIGNEIYKKEEAVHKARIAELKAALQAIDFVQLSNPEGGATLLITGDDCTFLDRVARSGILLGWKESRDKALGIWKPEPEDNKEPDTFADIFDSHAEAFHDLCQHIIDTTSDDRQSLQTYEPSTKVWHDIRIGNAMLMMDVGQIELTRVRYTPK